MIEREVTPRLIELFGQYPFVTVTGPRQSGKTTLCRTAFPQLRYVSLEAPDTREFAESDPRRFLAQGGAILDEIQRVPALLSYLQIIADEEGKKSLFVLTGSEQFGLAISQSLAERTALLRLPPFSFEERRRAGAGSNIDDILYSGFYPRIHDQRLEPRQALGDYFETYVERDVRRIGEIRIRFSKVRPLVRRTSGTACQSFFAGHRRRRFAHNCKALAIDSRGELRGFPAAALSCELSESRSSQIRLERPIWETA